MINGVQQIDLHLEEGENAYIVSDVHGEYDLLMEALTLLGYKQPHNNFGRNVKIRDRLFVVGDIVDRGPESYKLLQAVRHNPSYFALRGNHERIAKAGAENRMSDRVFWMECGGKWLNDNDHFAVRESLAWADALPDGIDLRINDTHRIAMTHAGFPPFAYDRESKSYDWDVVISGLSELKSQFGGVERPSHSVVTNAHVALEWLSEERYSFRNELDVKVIGADAAIHGHCYSKHGPKQFGDRLYIDGGAGKLNDDYALNILVYSPKKGKLAGLFEVCRFKRSNLTGRVEML